MFKKITYLAITIAAFMLIHFSDANAQGTPMPVGPYNWGTYSTNYIYGVEIFTAPRDFWIVRVNALGGYGSGNQSIEVYRMNGVPSYGGQFWYDNPIYGPYSPWYTPLWSVRNWGGGTGPVPINQGNAYPSGTVNDIYCTSGTTYMLTGNIGNAYHACYWGYGYNSNIGGTPVTLWGGYVYNPYQMFYGYSYYGWMYQNSSFAIGRIQIYYLLPCYIYVNQTAGGTISPGITFGPFKPGVDVNRDYTITPIPGKHIVDVTINGITVGSITRPVHTQHFGIVNSTQTLSAVYGNQIVAKGYGCSINPTGTKYYVTGSNPSFVLTPYPGAFISTITATGTSSGVVNIPVLNSGTGQTVALGQPGYPFSNLNEDWTLDVICMMNLFTSVGPHGTINPLGSKDIVWGTLYPVIITPDPNYKVGSLLIDGYDVMDPTQPGYPHPGLDLSAWPVVTFNIDMSYSHTVHATFYAWEITPEVIGTGGTIDPSTKVRVADHGQYPFIVTPDLDYHIDSIKAVNLSNGSITVFGNIPLHGALQIMFKDIVNDWRLEALFSIDMFKVVVKNAKILEGGMIFPTGTLSESSNDGLINVRSGTDLNFSIKPDLGWKIKDVLLDGVSQGNVSSLALTTIRADHQVEAKFQKLQYTITATAGNHGTIAMDGWTGTVPSNGAYPVYYGDNARFIVTPDHGYKLSELKVDGVVVNPELEHTFYYVTANHTITASFVPTNRYTITATAGTGGTINPSGAVSVIEGDNQLFTWTPNTGYAIADVLIDGVSQGQIPEYTFTGVTTDHTIEIIFNPIITYGLQCSLDATQLVSGVPFSITVTCVNQATQQPVNPPAPVNVTITKAAGALGTLTGTVTGTIPANDNKVTISGIVYTNAAGEANVQLVAGASGMSDCMMTSNFLAAEPQSQDAGIKFDKVSTYSSKDGSTALSQVTISWTEGDGAKRLVVMKKTDPIGTAELPVDGTGYTANSIFETGEGIGGGFVIFNAAGNTLTVTNLIEGTLYYVRVFGYNGDAALANYNTNTATDNPSSFLVEGADETMTASGFEVTNISPNPAYNEIKFNLNVGTASAFTVEVVDLQGRTVASFCNKRYLENGTYPVTIPISNLTNGSYILKIYNGTDFAYQVFTIVR